MAMANSNRPKGEEITEVDVERNFRAFRSYLEQNIKPVELIAYYDLFSTDQKKQIRQLYKSDPVDAIRVALDMIQKMEDPGKYLCFLRALEDAEYPKLVSVLNGNFVPVAGVHRQKIDLSARHIFKLLKPTNVIPYLLSKKVISNNDAEEIRNVENNNSQGNAAIELMFILPSRSKDWYRLFLQSLVDANHIELAELIDTDLTEELVAKKESGEQFSMHGMAVSLQPRAEMEKEMIQDDEDSGEPVSANNLSAPNMMEKFPDLGSIEEMLDEINNDEKGCGELSISETGEKIQLMGANDKATPRSKTKDIIQMKALDCSVNEETTSNLGSVPKSPECNFNVQQQEETYPKLLHDREPPDGGEIERTRNTSSENQQLIPVKTMKDKDISSSIQEDKLDNIRTNIVSDEYAREPDDDDVADDDISLREYQTELAEPAIQGKNVLIVAPTGSGKTRVALKIMQEHMRKTKGRAVAKVIFLVNQVALANQQAEECNIHLKKYTTKVISGDTQRSKGECLKDFVDKRDIMVVTAQVLLDALVKKEINNITKFSLMIFDECHHTHANHPFNQIMSMYLDLKLNEKFDKTALPQIIGLTASVGVGKAKDVKQAVQHIKSLMANLDSQVICTVQNNMSELRRYVNLPEEETCTVSRRSHNIFGKGVTAVMATIEKMMSSSSLVTELDQAAQFESTLRAPAEKGSDQYTQWLSKLWKETAKLRNQEARRFLNPCRAHLEYYNNSLIIYNDARVEDALNYLRDMMKRWKENAIMNDNEKQLEVFYERTVGLPLKQDSVNPKLEKLKEMILKAYKGDENFKNSRGIVFVKTRDLATAIVSWMKETPGLKELNAIKFVGQNESADKGGMTKAEQDDALKYFKDGKHKLIVATSVAEEGLDISKCNLVIRYDHVTNEIAMVQSRGRGRAEDSKYILVAEKGKGMAEKEELNMIREVLMRKAIIQLQGHIMDSPRSFREELHKLQDAAKLDRDIKAVRRKGKRIMRGEFELRCLRCSEFICMSSDVKKIQNAHHVCVDESLKDRVDFIRGTSKYIDDTIQAVGKLICSECGFDLGGIIIHKTLEFPVLKIEKYLIVDMNERQDTCKAWKRAPFDPQPLTTADFRDILQKKEASGEL